MSKRLDATGRPVRVGDLVRIVGLPDLAGMRPAARRESARVFEHILGTYKRVRGFDRHGHAELYFRIVRGRSAGLHTVWLEPHLLRVRRSS